MRLTWPWGRKRQATEVREASQGYTDLMVAGLLARATGARTEDPASTAAVEVAAGIWGRAMASAEVKGDARAREAVTPRFLSLAARNWIRRGEDLHALRLTPAGGVRLLPAASWDVSGDADPASWHYRVDLFAPSSVDTRVIPRAGVVHSMYACHAEEPWRGSPPWRFANLSAGLLASLERRLAQEAAGPVGQLVPLPLPPAEDEDDEDPLKGLQKTITALDGRVALVETTSAGMELGPSEAPRQDWQPRRIGANPPASLATLRSDAAEAVIQACGVPASLVTDRDGTALREAVRRYFTTTVEPKALELAGELSEALETPVAFSFRRAWAHDLVGRANAFKILVDAGLPVPDALQRSGLADV